MSRNRCRPDRTQRRLLIGSDGLPLLSLTGTSREICFELGLKPTVLEEKPVNIYIDHLYFSIYRILLLQKLCKYICSCSSPSALTLLDTHYVYFYLCEDIISPNPPLPT